MQHLSHSKIVSAIVIFILTMTVGLCSSLSASAADYTEQTVVVSKNGQVVDSFMGIDSEYVLYYSDTGYYCCASYVSKFYQAMYGVTVYNINIVDDKPSVYCYGKNVELRAVQFPKPGDIMQTKDYSHVAIVKSCDGDEITLIEQNYKWSWSNTTYTVVNRKVIRGNHYYYRLYIDGVAQSLDIDETAPTITNSQSSGVTNEGYTVSATVKDNKKVTKVKTCTYTLGSDKADIKWNTYTNPSQSFSVNVKTADFSSKDDTYVTKIYAYDSAGNVSSSTIKTYVDTTAPTITNAKAGSITAKGFAVSCSVSDVSGISKVEVPVWTNKNGMDDKKTLTPTASGNTVSFNISTSDHNNESGLYRVKIKVYDKFGNMSYKLVDVTVNPATAVSLNVSSVKIKESATKTVTAKMSGSNLTDYVSWNSTDENIATVDSGVITAQNVGKATVVAKTTGGKTAQCSVSVYADISGAEVKTVANQLYKGSQACPDLTVKYGGKLLVSGTDYIVSYSDCDAIGKATAIISGTGLFTGQKTITYNIVPDVVQNEKISAFTSNTATVTWKAVNDADGYFVYRYNSSTKKWVKIKNVKSCEFTDKGLTSGATYKYRVRAYKKVNGEYYLSDMNVSAGVVTRPEKTTCKAVSTKSQTATITWEKLVASGYEVVVSDSGKSTTYKCVGDTRKLTFNYTAKSGSNLYVRVRGYRMVEGKRVYGVYASTVTVKVK